MTDPSPSQTEPTEPAEGSPDAPAAGEERAPQQGPQPPRWSETQPEPAPWYVGRPGAVKPNGTASGGNAGWPMPPQDAPPHAQGPQGPAQGGSQGGPQGQPPQGPAKAPGDGQGGERKPGQQGEVPSWTGRLPERGGQNGQGQQGGQGQGGPGGQGQGPGQRPPQNQGQWGPFGPPQRRPDGSGPGQQRPGATAEPRGPLDLRSRWARGLALGATACMLIALWYAYSNIAAFPTFLISAGVSLVLGMVGLWLGVFAQRAAMRKNKRAPEAVSAIVWSSIAAFISLMILAYSMIFYTQLSQFATCMRSATTIALQNKCVSDYENSYTGQG